MKGRSFQPDSNETSSNPDLEILHNPERNVDRIPRDHLQAQPLSIPAQNQPGNYPFFAESTQHSAQCPPSHFLSDQIRPPGFPHAFNNATSQHIAANRLQAKPPIPPARRRPMALLFPSLS